MCCGYAKHYLPTFKQPEVRMMLSAFAAMEAVHQEAYSLLLETLGFGDDEYQKFFEHKAMLDKHEYLHDFGMDTPMDIAKTMAIYSGFTEGVQLFSSFAILLNFPRHNLMKGMGQIVTWSIRDETLHVEGMSQLFRTYIKENPDHPGSAPEELTYQPSTIGNANRVLLNFTNTNNSAGDYSRVNIKDENGVLQGTVLVQRSIPMII